MRRYLFYILALPLVGSLFLGGSVDAAADYPGSHCAFSQESQTKITASCSDDQTNGGFDKKSFNGDGSGNFTLVETGKTTQAATYPNYGTTTVDLKCTATITITGEGTSRSATIKGDYLKSETTYGAPYTSSTTSSCTKLLEGKIKISSTTQKSTAWSDTIKSNLFGDLVDIACKGKQGKDRENCSVPVINKINSCLSESSVKLGADSAARKTALNECIKKAFSPPSAITIPNNKLEDVVNAAASKAEKEADKFTDIEGDTTTTSPKSSCTVEGGLGWVICPIMNTLATLNDKAFDYLQNFLEIKSSTVNNSAMLEAWGKFRDIANLAFIGAFMIIIYSQMTSRGISNYGTKRILPRIVVAAVLVNISFWICAAVIDISNIVGNSIFSLLSGLVKIEGAGTGAVPNGWTEVIGGILTAAATVALLLAVILAPSVLLAVAVVVIILIARQAFVVLLVVLAPLAFVAYLLPNTEDWFKKWRKIFMSILMVYPIIGAVFGASTLASNVLAPPGAKVDVEMKLAALAVMGIPLFAVPVLLKGAMSSAGAIGQKLSGLQDRANARSRKGIAESRLGEAKTAFDARRATRKINRRLGHGRLAKWGQTGSTTDADGNVTYRNRRAAAAAWLGTRQKALDNSRFADRIGATRGAAAATSTYNKELNEETERQQSTMGEKRAPELLSIARDTKQTAERRAAALRQLEHVGGHQHIQEAYDYLMREGAAGGKDIGDVQQLAAKSLLNRRPAGVGKTQANALTSGKMTGEGYNDSLRQRLRDQKFDERSLAAMDVDDIARFAQMQADGKLTAEDTRMLDELNTLIKKNPNLSIDGEKQHALSQALYGPHKVDGSASTRPTNTRGDLYDTALVSLDPPQNP